MHTIVYIITVHGQLRNRLTCNKCIKKKSFSRGISVFVYVCYIIRNKISCAILPRIQSKRKWCDFDSHTKFKKVFGWKVHHIQFNSFYFCVFFHSNWWSLFLLVCVLYLLYCNLHLHISFGFVYTQSIKNCTPKSFLLLLCVEHLFQWYFSSLTSYSISRFILCVEEHEFLILSYICSQEITPNYSWNKKDGMAVAEGTEEKKQKTT